MRFWVLAVALIVVGASAPARSAPTIDIRAQTQLQLESVKLRDEGLAEVAGQLLDRLTGDGLGGQSVSITIDGQITTTTTQPDGRFRAIVGVPIGQTKVELGFRGSALLDPSKLEVTTDPSREQVQLSILVDPDEVTEGQGDARRIVGVRLTVDRVSGALDRAKLPVQIEVGNAADLALHKLRVVETGTPFTLTRKDAKGPGTKRVRATFAGDATRQLATTEVTVEIKGETHTSMKVSSTELAYEDELVVTGKVTDDDGAAMSRVAVTLVSGDRRLAQGATDDKGTYRFEVEGEIIGQGQFGIQVQSDIGVAYLKPSRSEPAIIRVAAPQPVPVSYTIAAFLATGLAAGGFFLARSKPWKKLRRAKQAAEIPANEGPAEILDGGLVTNKPSVISTLRRPQDDGFSGVVRDTVRSRPVPEAVVILVLGDVERSVRTADDGSFTIEKLAVGEWRAEVAAPGHVTERFNVSIPHRGELRGVRVDLVPVRERVFQLYRRAAEPVLPEARLWGIWSPRQIVDHVKSKKRSPAMSDLTDFVEEVYFSPRLAAETLLSGAKERVDRAIQERAVKPPAADQGRPG
ncbi:MAG: carboxypeptidase-like regulatory domain-containing protein [Kofleriaceae bacterium]